MPDPLMLPFQRPSDEELAVMRAVEKGHDLTDAQADWLCQQHGDDTGLVWQDEDGDWHIGALGRLVLAACDTDANNDAGSTEPGEATGKLPSNPVKNADAPDPVGKVVEAAPYRIALRNCLALAQRHKGEGDWAHIIRFCAAAEVKPSALRGSRPKIMPDLPEIFVRNRLDKITKEESAFYELINHIEGLGAHEHLTNCVVLLAKAREELADWIELDRATGKTGEVG